MIRMMRSKTMKKHNMELSYKDLHAIKHALEYRLDELKYMILYVLKKDENEAKQDIEYEEKLLERITEKINYLKDKYKI
jgi:hypothetical protein